MSEQYIYRLVDRNCILCQGKETTLNEFLNTINPGEWEVVSEYLGMAVVKHPSSGQELGVIWERYNQD